MIGDPPKPPNGSKKEEEPALSFEEFSHRDKDSYPRYNNFFLLFSTSKVGDSVRKKEFYIKFASEHPKMAVELLDKLQKRDKSKGKSESLKPLERDLYEAYKIMRSYGISDYDLFQ